MTFRMFQNGIAVVFIVYLAHVRGEDPGVPHQQYLTAFENLPALFERIIDMLQEKPEILEKNDVSTFLEFAAANDGASSGWDDGFNFFKREANLEDIDDNSQNLERYDRSLLKADGFEGFVGAGGTGEFMLTADEVAERMLMVERKLEEYYNETN